MTKEERALSRYAQIVEDCGGEDMRSIFDDKEWKQMRKAAASLPEDRRLKEAASYIADAIGKGPLLDSNGGARIEELSLAEIAALLEMLEEDGGAVRGNRRR